MTLVIDNRSPTVALQHRRECLRDPDGAEQIGVECLSHFLDVRAEQRTGAADASIVDDDGDVTGEWGKVGEPGGIASDANPGCHNRTNLWHPYLLALGEPSAVMMLLSSLCIMRPFRRQEIPGNTAYTNPLSPGGGQRSPCN